MDAADPGLDVVLISARKWLKGIEPNWSKNRKVFLLSNILRPRAVANILKKTKERKVGGNNKRMVAQKIEAPFQFPARIPFLLIKVAHQV